MSLGAIECQNCKTINHPNAKICIGCKGPLTYEAAFLPEEREEQPKVAEVSAKGILYCPRCKKLVSGGKLLCPVCRTFLIAPPEDLSEELLVEARRDEELLNKPIMSVLGWGIFSLIGGIISFLLSAPKMDVIRSGVGMLAAGLSEKTAREFQVWQYVYYFSIIALIVGGLLILVGAIQKAFQSK